MTLIQRLVVSILAVSALSACDSNGPPETVTGRWEGMAEVTIDTTLVTARGRRVECVGFRTEKLTVNIEDTDGALRGTYKKETTLLFRAFEGDVLISEARDSYEQVSSFLGSYASPSMRLLIPDPPFQDLELSVSGGKATGSVPLYLGQQIGDAGDEADCRRSGQFDLELRRVI